MINKKLNNFQHDFQVFVLSEDLSYEKICNICEEENEVMPTSTLIGLMKSVPGVENVDEENTEEWLGCAKDNRGCTV